MAVSDLRCYVEIGRLKKRLRGIERCLCPAAEQARPAWQPMGMQLRQKQLKEQTSNIEYRTKRY